jgi:hypothetical protein
VPYVINEPYIRVKVSGPDGPLAWTVIAVALGDVPASERQLAAWCNVVQRPYIASPLATTVKIQAGSIRCLCLAANQG